MVESVRIPGIGRIHNNTEKLSERAPERLNLCEYQKTVESLRVPGIGRICESTKKLFGRVPEKGRIRVSSEKW